MALTTKIMHHSAELIISPEEIMSLGGLHDLTKLTAVALVILKSASSRI
jgi:hypothetical protein